MPRKPSVASIKIMLPKPSVIDTISWGITLGRRCLNILDAVDSPEAFAASINSCSLKESICPLTSLAVPTQPIRHSTIII